MEYITPIFDAIERGLLYLREVTDFHGEAGEVWQRLADKLVQWSFAIMMHVSNGQGIFESVVNVRDFISSEIENAARHRRGRPSMYISERQLSFYLENGFTVGRIAEFFWMFTANN